MDYPKQLFLFQIVCLFYTIFFLLYIKKKKQTKKKHKQFESFIKIPPPNKNFASKQKKKRKKKIQNFPKMTINPNKEIIKKNQTKNIFSSNNIKILGIQEVIRIAIGEFKFLIPSPWNRTNKENLEKRGVLLTHQWEAGDPGEG
jgi:hypothetical protein